MVKHPHLKKDLKFIVQVSAVEGIFNHYKTEHHPHTNMAKAALNMLTRTSSSDYKRDMIFMNAVDTGWITDMNPHIYSKRISNKYKHDFKNPLDEVDGAARILDPIFIGLKTGKCQYGRLFKDYQIVEW